MKLKKDRIVEIDLMRGVAVLLMIFDHFMYDLGFFLPTIFNGYPANTGLTPHIYSIAVSYWDLDIRLYIRYIVIFIFLVLTGICCVFSRNNLARGLKLLVVAYALTLGTYILGLIMDDKDMMISFGILHAIGYSLVIIGLLEKFIKNKWIYLAIGIICLGIGAYFEVNINVESYEGNNFFVLTLKQMVGLVYCGSDCFPLIFNGGQILMGVFLGKLLYPNRESLLGLPYYNNPVTFIGRNSLLVYVAHQIIIPIILSIILLICGFKLTL